MEILAYVVGGLLVAFLLYLSTRPATFQVQRSATIPAPPERIIPWLEDFHRWEAWSPWEGLDPGMRRTYAGPERGLGAIYAWDGNKKVGSGRMEIVDVVPGNRVVSQLEFIRPFRSSNTTAFTLEPRGGGTEVTWSMRGKNTLPGKVMGMFMDMDRMVGRDFEKGLAALRAAVEGEASAASKVPAAAGSGGGPRLETPPAV